MILKTMTNWVHTQGIIQANKQTHFMASPTKRGYGYIGVSRMGAVSHYKRDCFHASYLNRYNIETRGPHKLLQRITRSPYSTFISIFKLSMKPTIFEFSTKKWFVWLSLLSSPQGSHSFDPRTKTLWSDTKPHSSCEKIQTKIHSGLSRWYSSKI